MNANSSGPPTQTRYWVVLVASLSAILLYVHRFCISFGERFIKEDLLLSDRQIGFILSSFFWSYAFAQVPSGWLSDRYGARRMLTFYIVLWSLFTVLTGLVTGLLVLIVVRLGFGIAQAGAYPTSAALLSKWVPFPRRAVASSVVAFGGRVGGALAPIVTAYLILVFVPISESSLLQEGDLLDPPLFCSTISQAGEDSSGKRLLEALSDSRQAFVGTLAARYQDALELRSENDETPRLELSPDDQREVQLLIAELNAQLSRPEFLSHRDAEDMSAASPPRELQQLVERQPSTLSAAEIERRNRLAIELALPDAIRKVYVRGWRPAFILLGLAGVFVAALCWILLRNRPSEHPRCNDAEVALIETGRPTASPHGRVEGIPWGPILRSRSIWMLSFSQFGVNIGWVFLVTWLPRYLAEEHAVPIVERATLTAIPLFVGWVGMLSGGVISDLLVSRVGLRWGRRTPWIVSRFIATVAFLSCLFDPTPVTATIAFCAVAFCTDVGTSSGWAFNQDIGGQHVGAVLGFGNMCGNIGAAVSPLLLNEVVKGYGWNGAFLVCAGGFLFASLMAFGVDASKPIMVDDDAKSASGDD